MAVVQGKSAVFEVGATTPELPPELTLPKNLMEKDKVKHGRVALPASLPLIQAFVKQNQVRVNSATHVRPRAAVGRWLCSSLTRCSPRTINRGRLSFRREIERAPSAFRRQRRRSPRTPT
jgi:hypothetical protein